MENKEWVWDSGVLVEKDVEAWKLELIKTKKRALEEKKLEIFKSMLIKL
jgi:hypothetical protein